MSLVEKIYAKLKNASLLGSVCVDLGEVKIYVHEDGTPMLEASQTDCTLTLTPQTLQELSEGSLDAMSAYFSGDILITGDMGVALSLAQLLKAK